MQHKQTAQGLASLGRGPDTELVHMTKGEVHGLQQLAMSHGGTLTINPRTGLPEAGFLSSILPTVIGAAAVYFSGGTLTPLVAAAMTGGGYALATGSLKKGLMAGLGAYGGAGLAAGVGAAGAGALSAEAAAAANAAPMTTAGIDAVATTAAPTAGSALGANVTSMYPAAPTVMPSFAAAPSTAASPFSSGIETLTQAPTVAANTFAAAPVPAAPVIPQADLYSAGLKDITSSGTKAGTFAKDNQGALFGIGAAALSGAGESKLNAPAVDQGMIRPYTFDRTQNNIHLDTPIGAQYVPGQSTRERQWFNDKYTAGTPYKSPGPEYMAEGGPVAAMTDANMMGQNTGYPMAGINTNTYAAPSQNVAQGTQDAAVNPYTGQAQFAAGGGISNLGGYSDGGQLLRGPGDGVSDSIPARIGAKQEARLADGEFVVPARIVSELGNGSTEAGSRQLYAMMDRVQKARKKTVGKGNVATDANARNLLPA